MSPIQSWETFFDYLVFLAVAVLMCYVLMIFFMVTSYIKARSSLVE